MIFSFFLKGLVNMFKKSILFLLEKFILLCYALFLLSVIVGCGVISIVTLPLGLFMTKGNINGLYTNTDK